LTSRICHPHPEVAALTRGLVTRLLVAFPQHGLWALAAVSKSTVTARRTAANAIVQAAKRQVVGEENRRLFVESGSFCEQLIRLCFHQSKQRISAKKEFSHLVRSFPLQVMMPTISALSLRPHEAPPSELVTVAGMEDGIEVLRSLQLPKKLTLLGSDGERYTFLAKPKDDLRKDTRMMEAAGVLNALFAGDADARRRGLGLRRFAVLALTEDCGLVQWVPHTQGLRHCCQDVYAAEGLFDPQRSNQAVKALYDGAAQQRRKSELMTKVLQMFPPRLHRWVLATFPEPAAWLAARNAFTHSAAVWSMVGHVVGLGDRHGENILVDTSSGDVVHVDFSCLFDKGLTLEKPEMVPFRLTQNVIDVFGVSGHEGIFRKASEITLRVLRANRDTILSVMDTFLHDPLVEWVRSGARSEGGNPHAQDAMETIAGRLQGTLLGVSSMPCLPLSVEGQAERLIQEATDRENLGNMYIWWMAWF
ncbi:phosphatidylinositol 3- and 4-kinase, partial [Helicosporidium sp. ATCC 50920]